jgi:hypothetical protein
MTEVLETTEEGKALLEAQVVRDRAKAAEWRDMGARIRRMELDYYAANRWKSWDARFNRWLAAFVEWFGWANLYKFAVSGIKRLIIAAAKFTYTHWRGFVREPVYRRRLVACFDCDHLEHKEQRRLWLGPKRRRDFCRGGPEKSACGMCPDYRLSALKWRLRLYNFACPNVIELKMRSGESQSFPAPRFGMGDWFPEDKE